LKLNFNFARFFHFLLRDSTVSLVSVVKYLESYIPTDPQSMFVKYT